MIKTLLSALMLFSVIQVQGETMECVVGVYKAKDMKDDNKKPHEGKIVAVKLKDNAGESEVVINGESVFVGLYQKGFSDVYQMDVILMTPTEDRIPGASYVTSILDFIYNAGATRDNGWDLNPKQGSVRYEYLQRPSGSIVITPKLRKALEKAGKWGKYPFTGGPLDMQVGPYIAEAVNQLMSKGALKPNDVVSIATLLSCTKQK